MRRIIGRVPLDVPRLLEQLSPSETALNGVLLRPHYHRLATRSCGGGAAAYDVRPQRPKLNNAKEQKGLTSLC